MSPNNQKVLKILNSVTEPAARGVPTTAVSVHAGLDSLNTLRTVYELRALGYVAHHPGLMTTRAKVQEAAHAITEAGRAYVNKHFPDAAPVSGVIHVCTHCATEVAEEDTVWLEHSDRDGRFHLPGAIRPGDSTGQYPFDANCAKKARAGVRSRTAK